MSVSAELRQHSADETVRDSLATFQFLNSVFQLDDASEEKPRDAVRKFLDEFGVYAAAVSAD